MSIISKYGRHKASDVYLPVWFSHELKVQGIVLNLILNSFCSPKNLLLFCVSVQERSFSQIAFCFGESAGSLMLDVINGT